MGANASVTVEPSASVSAGASASVTAGASASVTADVKRQPVWITSIVTSHPPVSLPPS